MSAELHRWVLASGNRGKLQELTDALKALPIDLVPQSEYRVSEAVEDGLTFIENALIKARHASDITGLPSLADDSGLSVSALQGKPGIYSARFAASTTSAKPTDAENIDHLLNCMRDVPAGKRQARFTCVLVWLAHASDPEPIVALGSWQGEITLEQQGQGGFGYDPVFYCPRSKSTAAQLGHNGKRKVSHRGQALEQLQTMLSTRLKLTATS